MDSDAIYAPGARVEIRDCEWIVRRADPSDDGGYVLHVDGLSELVIGKSAQFLTELESDNIRLLDPAETSLEQDTSPGFELSRLFIETQLRQITPSDDRIHLGHRAAMDPVPYQLDPALQALKQPRQRILIADAVGLGKTMEAGILVTELMKRGRGKRILALTLKSMMTQFQKEFWNRFTIPLTRLDSAGLQRVRNNIPGNHNPFYYYDKSIISIDTLKQDNEFRRHLEQAYWDIILIDECHNVAERSTHSQRAKLAQLLAHRSDTLIMLSATPHDGKARSFASLMNMLDPTAISDPDEYSKADFHDKGLVIRRFKKDIRDQVQEEFKERVVQDLYVGASAEEEAAYDALLAVPFTYKGEYHKDKQGQLVRIGLQKALFSSPAAALVSCQARIEKLEKTESVSEPEEKEIAAIKSLVLALENISIGAFTKYQRMLDMLNDKAFGWKKNNAEDRLVIFSERIETLNWLEDQLTADLKVKSKAITQLHGGMSDIEQQAIVEDFAKPDSPLRILLCSDVASEGINLHYLSHRLVHFDLPWSLMVFQQRNGRVDRYGQTDKPIITYLITESVNSTVRGDTRILEILKEKDQQAYENIGDPATFMKVHDAEEEERLTEEAMAKGASPESFDNQYQPDEQNEGDELLRLFLTPDNEAVSAKDEADQAITEPYSLFASDFDFSVKALAALNREKRQVDCTENADTQTLTLVMPDDLEYRFKFLPSEVKPEQSQLVMTADINSYEEEIKRSRRDENAWPKLHFLWSQHPALDWLQARILSKVARHSAPVLALDDSLESDETVFLVSGLIPNRKAHPVIWEWFAVNCRANKVTELQPAVEWLKALDLTKKRPNREQTIDIRRLEDLRKPVIELVTKEMEQRQKDYTEKQSPKLQTQLANLEALQGRQVEQLELDLSRSQQEEVFKNARRARRMKQIEEAFKDYRRWVQDTMTIEPVPFMQIIAVITRTSGQGE